MNKRGSSCIFPHDVFDDKIAIDTKTNKEKKPMSKLKMNLQHVDSNVTMKEHELERMAKEPILAVRNK